MFLQTCCEALTLQRIFCWVKSTIREWHRWLRSHFEQIGQIVDRVSNIHRAVVIGVLSVEANGRSLFKLVAQIPDRVGKVNRPVGVAVAAKERTGQDMNLPAFRIHGKAKTSDHGQERRPRTANLPIARANQSIHTLRARITYECVGGDMDVKSLARREDFQTQSGDHDARVPAGARRAVFWIDV